MNRVFFNFSILLLSVTTSFAGFLYTDWPYASYVGDPDPVVPSTAVHMSSNAVVAWADGYTNVVYGEAVDAPWQTPDRALGPALGTAMDIVCLGRGGQITMTFSRSIVDGAGFDFAVFENSFSSTFLELAWVEVSSDGTNFVRFPEVSYTLEGAQSVYAHNVHGLAGKYRQGYGTPFDLSELADVAAYISTNGAHLSTAYIDAFLNNWPHLDLNDVKYVRIVDVVGDGSAMCSTSPSRPIYDPYPTSGSAGFDLDAVGVINQATVVGDPQEIAFEPIPHQKMEFGSVELGATASSGLGISYSVQSGPATNSGSVLYFTGTGTVEVVANQAGDSTYAPASPVLRSFIIAEEIQHIFIEPVANQVQSGGTVQVNADSSRGLPVKMQVQSGPDSVLIDEDTHLLDLGTELGSVTLRAFQSGDSVTAPAEDVLISFEIVESSATNAPVSLNDWLTTNSVSEPSIRISEDDYGRSSVRLAFEIDQTVSAYSRIISSLDLVSWSNAVPEIVGQTHSGSMLQLEVQLSAENTNAFYRLELEEQ